jgi:SulP family sulfate permease
LRKIKLGFNRKTLSSDLTAGLTTALITIPDGLASAILAGVNPVQGLYSLMFGTPVAALTTGSQFMYVSNTGALAVAVGSVLAAYSQDEILLALAVLTMLVGAFQLLLGLLRMGWIVRFVSHSVMVGFMTGIALLIILGQLGSLTGYSSEYSNDLVALVDLVLNFNQVDLPTLTIGLITMVLIFLFGQTKLSKFSMILAMVGASFLVTVFDLSSVQLIADIADIPDSLPRPSLPDLSLVVGLILPAISVAIIGLVQAAGVSKSVANPDGKFGDISRDFSGQGLANLSASLFQGLPIGGTMSETSVNISAGAKTRLANLLSGLMIIVIVLVFGDVVEKFAMPSIAALLIVAGYQAIKKGQIADVWDTGMAPRLIMIFTFIATLFLPIQYAVFLGVALSVIQYWVSSSLDSRVVELVPQEDGSWIERPGPEKLADNQVTLLEPYGSLHYAAVYTLEDLLPSPETARGAVVILRLRGREQISSTFIEVIERYAQQLQANGNKLVLSDVHEEVKNQIDRTETTETIPEEDIFLATETRRGSTNAALAAAQVWIETNRSDEAQ